MAGCSVHTDRSLPIGSSAPDFSLAGVDGKQHSLSEYASSRVLAIVFTCNHCPAAQRYEERLKKIDQDYRSKGVTLVAINADNPDAIPLSELGYSDGGDSLADMKARASYRQLPYPYLYDGETQTVSTKFGVEILPQIFVFDDQRKLKYKGRIDDNVSESQVKARDARNAIDHAEMVESPRADAEHERILRLGTQALELADVAGRLGTLDQVGGRRDCAQPVTR